MKTNTKKIMFSVCIALLALSSCVKPNGTGYEGTNFIYLSTEGNTTIFEADATPLVVDVALTTALDADLTLTFVTSDKDGVVSLQDNPVIIKAGEKNGSFSIVSNAAGKLTKTTSYKVSLDPSCTLPSGVKLDSDFDYSVTPVLTDVLTDAQKAIIDSYKAATGIDLSDFLGFVNVSTVYVGTDLDSGEPLDPETINGKSIITLSELSTAEQPVLAMTANPMGIQDKMYRNLKAATIDNEMWYYTVDEGGIEDFSTLMNAIGWSKSSEEVFEMTLDSIKLPLDGSVEFLGEGEDQYGDPITIVPFGYKFSAYERELKAIEDGTLLKGDEWYSDATACPEYHINCDDISDDLYEMGNWTEASASISKDKLEFVFCVYPNALSYDYVRVTATYTPNK